MFPIGVLIGGIGMGYSAVAIPDILREAASLASSNSSVDANNNISNNHNNNSYSFVLPTIVATTEELSWFGKYSKTTSKSKH
jgi:hypothetical protein